MFVGVFGPVPVRQVWIVRNPHAAEDVAVAEQRHKAESLDAVVVVVIEYRHQTLLSTNEI